VLGISFLGWTLPSNIGTSALGGQSLFGALYQSIGENLAHFPEPPALDDKVRAMVCSPGLDANIDH
jgi:photosystem I subunit PsaO